MVAYRRKAIEPDVIGPAIRTAIEQPADVDVNEIVVRPLETQVRWERVGARASSIYSRSCSLNQIFGDDLSVVGEYQLGNGQVAICANGRQRIPKSPELSSDRLATWDLVVTALHPKPGGEFNNKRFRPTIVRVDILARYVRDVLLKAKTLPVENDT
jgi:hypothetical protein